MKSAAQQMQQVRDNSVVKSIVLSAELEMWSTYQGRGIPSRSIILQKGEAVSYNRMVLNSGQVVHTAWVVRDGRRYEATKRM